MATSAVVVKPAIWTVVNAKVWSVDNTAISAAGIAARSWLSNAAI